MEAVEQLTRHMHTALPHMVQIRIVQPDLPIPFLPLSRLKEVQLPGLVTDSIPELQPIVLLPETTLRLTEVVELRTANTLQLLPVEHRPVLPVLSLA